MGTTYLSPGVYVNERDDSLYAPAESPTLIGLVGTATKGDLNTATLITNEAQLTSIFGRPRTKDLAMHAAMEVLKDANFVYFCRIAGASAAKGLKDFQDAGSGATAASIGPSANVGPYNLLLAATEAPIGTRTSVLRLTWNNPGGGTQTDFDIPFEGTQASLTSGNAETYNFNAIAAAPASLTLTVSVNAGPVQTVTFSSTDARIAVWAAVTAEEIVEVCNDALIGAEARVNAAGTSVILASDTYGTGSTIQVTGGTANPAVNGLDFTLVAATGAGDAVDLSAVTITELNVVIAADSTADLVVTADAAGKATISTVGTGVAAAIEIISAFSTAVGASPLINWTPLDSTVNGTDTTAAADTLRLTASTDGSYSSDVSVKFEASPTLTSTVRMTVYYRDIQVEVYDKLYKSPTPVVGGYALITTINDGSTDGMHSASSWVVASDLDVTGENPAAIAATSLSAGDDGDDWTDATMIGTAAAGVYTGMQVYSNRDTIGVTLVACPGTSYATVIAAGNTLCDARGECLFVCDCPDNLTPQESVKWHDGDNSIGAVTVDQEARTETNTTVFNTSYGTVYYGWYQHKDAYNDALIYMPPCAMALRTMAYTDHVAYCWYAPAGPSRTRASGALDLRYSPTQGERDIMQQAGTNMNPIANMPGQGITIMGQKTLLRASSSLDRINVRRMINLAKKIVAASVEYLTFEQNDAVLWRRFINLVQPVFDDIKSKHGINNFRIICDSSTNTESLMENSTMFGQILIEPTKSAEIITVGFTLLPQGAAFEEYVQA